MKTLLISNDRLSEIRSVNPYLALPFDAEDDVPLGPLDISGDSHISIKSSSTNAIIGFDRKDMIGASIDSLLMRILFINKVIN
jgi:hypothetical protein